MPIEESVDLCGGNHYIPLSSTVRFKNASTYKFSLDLICLRLDSECYNESTAFGNHSENPLVTGKMRVIFTKSVPGWVGWALVSLSQGAKVGVFSEEFPINLAETLPFPSFLFY